MLCNPTFETRWGFQLVYIKKRLIILGWLLANNLLALLLIIIGGNAILLMVLQFSSLDFVNLDFHVLFGGRLMIGAITVLAIQVVSTALLV